MRFPLLLHASLVLLLCQRKVKPQVLGEAEAVEEVCGRFGSPPECDVHTTPGTDRISLLHSETEGWGALPRPPEQSVIGETAGTNEVTSDEHIVVEALIDFFEGAPKRNRFQTLKLKRCMIASKGWCAFSDRMPMCCMASCLHPSPIYQESRRQTAC